VDVRPVREVSRWSLASGVRLRELITLPRGLVMTWEVLGVVFAVCVWLCRHYVVTGTAAMLLASWVQFGTLWAAVPLACLVPAAYGVVKWQQLRARTEASTVGGVAQGLARIRVLQKRWPGVMHQLRMCSRDGSQTPPLTQAVATETGVKARVITGAIAADSQQLLKLEPQIAAGMFCDRVIVRSVSPSVASIRFDWGEHLRREYRLADLPELPPTRKGTPALIRFGVHADGTPAVQDFYPDGVTGHISHYTNGKRHDPADGTPAYQGFYPDGTPKLSIRYTNGERHDPADGTPAFQGFYPDGTPMWIAH